MQHLVGDFGCITCPPSHGKDCLVQCSEYSSIEGVVVTILRLRHASISSRFFFKLSTSSLQFVAVKSTFQRHIYSQLPSHFPPPIQWNTAESRVYAASLSKSWLQLSLEREIRGRRALPGLLPRNVLRLAGASIRTSNPASLSAPDMGIQSLKTLDCSQASSHPILSRMPTLPGGALTIQAASSKAQTRLGRGWRRYVAP